MATLRGPMLAAMLALLTAAKHPPVPVAPDPAPVAAPTIKAGVEKWRAGDYAGAVAIWQPFAAAGDADALFNLGQAYKLGRGVDADPAAARDYYRKAAVKGHLPAQANLGIALFQAGEKPEAIKWLKTAADRGEARAQYVLGIAAFNGDGVPRSQSLGYGYLLRAQASGLPQAVTALGTIAPGLSPGDRTAGEAIAASLAAGTGVPTALAGVSAPRLIAGGPPSRSTANLPVVTPPSRTAASLPVVTPPAAASSAPMPSRTTASLPVVTPPSSPSAGASPSRTAASLPVAIPPSSVSSTSSPARSAASLPVGTSPSSASSALPPVVTGAAVPSARPPAVAATVPAPPARSSASSRPMVVAAADPAKSLGGSTADRGVPPAPRPAVPVREPTPAQADAAAATAPRPPVATVDIAPSRSADATPRVADALTPPRVAVRPAAPPKPFEVADAPARKPDGWRVQLGAFSSRKLADAAWAEARSAAAPAKPVFATDGAVTKLQMGPFATRDAAKAACTKLTTAGRACFVTAG